MLIVFQDRVTWLRHKDLGLYLGRMSGSTSTSESPNNSSEYSRGNITWLASLLAVLLAMNASLIDSCRFDIFTWAESRGLGEEDDLEHLMTSSTSLWEIGSSLNGVVTGEGCRNQACLVYDLGWLIYTSVKKDSADSWLKPGMVGKTSSLKSWDTNLQKDCWHSLLALSISYVKAVRYVAVMNHEFLGRCVPSGLVIYYGNVPNIERDISNLCHHEPVVIVGGAKFPVFRQFVTEMWSRVFKSPPFCKRSLLSQVASQSRYDCQKTRQTWGYGTR